MSFGETDLWNGDDLLRSRVALEAETLVLRQQINVLLLPVPARSYESLPFLCSKMCSKVARGTDLLAIVPTDSVIRWRRAGFKSYWRLS